MNFRTFFSLLFILSISICLITTFYPDFTNTVLQYTNIHNSIKFVGLTSLIISIFSYLGMIISFYFASKREKKRLLKLKKDRELIDSIHAELEELRK